jgi:hypothetical protein
MIWAQVPLGVVGVPASKPVPLMSVVHCVASVAQPPSVTVASTQLWQVVLPLTQGPPAVEGHALWMHPSTVRNSDCAVGDPSLTQSVAQTEVVQGLTH